MNNSVNLMDIKREPTDAQLRLLMRSVVEGVKSRKEASDLALKLSLEAQIQMVRSQLPARAL